MLIKLNVSKAILLRQLLESGLSLKMINHDEFLRVICELASVRLIQAIGKEERVKEILKITSLDSSFEIFEKPTSIEVLQSDFIENMISQGNLTEIVEFKEVKYTNDDLKASIKYKMVQEIFPEEWSTKGKHQPSHWLKWNTDSRFDRFQDIKKIYAVNAWSKKIIYLSNNVTPSKELVEDVRFNLAKEISRYLLVMVLDNLDVKVNLQKEFIQSFTTTTFGHYNHMFYHSADVDSEVERFALWILDNLKNDRDETRLFLQARFFTYEKTTVKKGIDKLIYTIPFFGDITIPSPK